MKARHCHCHRHCDQLTQWVAARDTTASKITFQFKSILLWILPV